MEKKNYQLRPYSRAQDPARPNWEHSGKKYVEKFDYGKKLPNNRANRNNQRCVRTREKSEPKGEVSEVGSVQKSGSKKQNITHLLNWWDTGSDPRGTYSTNDQSVGARTRHPKTPYVKFNKEHYLQANCQFVVPLKCDLSFYEHDPDRLIDWEHVEEVRLNSAEYPSCPICLHPPIAAKITKCGHIFCFPCVLHYLALTDRKWQRCPICYEAITRENLKSVVTVVHKSIQSGEEIELTLMRRERNSNTPVPVSEYSKSYEKLITLSSFMKNSTTHSKFIVASNVEISDLIIQRELDELQCQFALEGDQPEACFISEALNIVEQRKSLLSSGTDSAKGLVCDQDSMLETDCNDQFVVGRFDSSNLDIGVKDDVSPLFGSPAEAFDPNENFPQQCGPDGLKSTFYFYQEANGAHLYLHPLNVRMLVKEYGSLDQCPLSIKGKILEKESCIVTEDTRHRSRYLRHLPIACPFELVEIELKPPLVSLFSLVLFRDQLKQREKKRKKKVRQESTIERRAQLEEDRLMGRSRGSSFNTSSLQHFPSFNSDECMGAVAIASSSIEEETTPLSSSVSSTDCGRGTPSFAQMICSGKKKTTFVRPATSSLQRKQDNLDSDENETGVPDFGTAFSDAFAKALDLAAKNAKKGANSSGISDRQDETRSKKKKKKGILLLSSGGR